MSIGMVLLLGFQFSSIVLWSVVLFPKQMDSFYVLLLGVFLLITFFVTILVCIQRRKGMRTINKDLTSFIQGSMNQRLQEHPSVLSRDIYQRINTILEMHQETSIGWKDSERSRKTWLSNISHDIRTPLTAIIGYIDALNDSPGSRDQYQEKYISILKEKSMYLKKRIDALFLIARQESGDKALDLQTIDINELLRKKIIEFRPQLEKAHFTVEVNIDDMPTYILADEAEIDRLVDNLIQNILEHASSGRYLGVDLSSWRDNSVTIAFNDRGPGVPRGFEEIIFQRLKQEQQIGLPKSQGAGLGLNICRNIVKRHKGSISCENTGDGLGMIVVLPQKPSIN